jgi:hypothetical protein
MLGPRPALESGMTSEKKSFLLAQLQIAIDEAVSDSRRVGEIVEQMKLSGYDLSLLLESTITITPTEDYQADALPEPRLSAQVSSSNGEMELTDADLEFLQELSIAA